MSLWCCIGTGPSITQQDVDAVRGRAKVIAINDAGYLWAPWADALYAADPPWWHVYYDRCAPHFQGRMYSIETQDPVNPKLLNQLYGVTVLDKQKGEGLSRTPGALRTGGIGGYQAINLAYLWGAKTILLLGYDMQRTGGKSHSFGDHPRPLNNCSSYEKRIPALVTIVPEEYGIQIINCSRETAIHCFPRMTIDEALEAFA